MNSHTYAGDRIRLDLAGGAQELAQARRFLSVYAEQAGVGEDRTEELVQAAGELFAVGAPQRWATAVSVREDLDGLTVVVDLAGDGPLEVGAESELLLSAFSRQWGWRRDPHVVQVWCEMALLAPPP